ncbi:MAG: hypothetical protein LBM01_03140 [Christensenellaceae bacterium]|jgi:hypothetical protein|nr:hypothetical protein [Christensenellaceae bacterium]
MQVAEIWAIASAVSVDAIFVGVSLGAEGRGNIKLTFLKTFLLFAILSVASFGAILFRLEIGARYVGVAFILLAIKTVLSRDDIIAVNFFDTLFLGVVMSFDVIISAVLTRAPQIILAAHVVALFIGVILSKFFNRVGLDGKYISVLALLGVGLTHITI